MLQKEFDRLERLIRNSDKKNSNKSKSDIDKLKEKIQNYKSVNNLVSNPLTIQTQIQNTQDTLPNLQLGMKYVPTEYTEGDGVLDSVTTLNEFESGSTIVTLNGLEQIKDKAYTEVDSKTIQFAEVIDEDIVIGIKYIRSN